MPITAFDCSKYKFETIKRQRPLNTIIFYYIFRVIIADKVTVLNLPIYSKGDKRKTNNNQDFFILR